ncbi:ATP-binding cassette sub-family A member 3 [Eumeta japonica]|uniref:ATP-binding cassette sub-family A member 3 n=1 Tax=Eumeta variegata TaxID=151549 RepID=A0A4C1WX84_EUMVA|nr:ATP-binding cassette sub-family A member 3 [Eumeta japonica]
MATPTAKNASAFAKLRLLMWKNFLQQWRHKWRTLIEVALPVLTMALVLILRWQIQPRHQNEFLYPPIPVGSFSFSWSILLRMELENLTFAYSPTSPVLEEVIQSSVASLVSPINAGFFPWPIETKVVAYNNSDQLNALYFEEENTRIILAAIQFDDSLLGATELPKNISYSIRFPERPRTYSFSWYGAPTWRTDLLFPAFETIGPRERASVDGGNDPGYISELFIALQHSVSMELVSRLTDVDLRGYPISVQRFPHPAYLHDFATELLQYLLPTFFLISFSYAVVNLVKSVTLEKEMQLKVPWFTTEEGISGYSVFTNTPWTVLLFFISLYLACIIFFCFMLSGFFPRAGMAALVSAIIWFLSNTPSMLMMMDTQVSPFVQGITCLSLNTAMSYGFNLILAAESSGGMQWGNFMTAPSTNEQFLFGHVVIMLVVDCVLYMLIALYLEKVLPGKYGVPHPWYFPVQPSFWFPDLYKNANIISPVSNTVELVQEEDPVGNPTGIQISKLTKAFKANVVVNELSLNVYEGQITVLLGHNGAGKTTTISILTGKGTVMGVLCNGNIKPSYGTVVLGGYNLSTHLEAARAQLGLCPQHNVIFDDLTVEEHIEFFSRLKGYTGNELKAEINMLINKLELQEKRQYYAGGLSGGQKRRLSVGVALSGGTRIVLLDEPTSGMDPSARRALWELLQREKKDRTILLTTHFMDEADVLGDRVAIMAHGRLQCVGSPYFLKRHYGVGYTLVVVKGESFDEGLCTKVIRKYIADVNVKEDRELESKTNEIDFKDYGLTATTLEDVFMRVGSDIGTMKMISENDNVTVSSDTFSEDALRCDVENASQEYFITLGTLNLVTNANSPIYSRQLTLNEGFSRTETLLAYEGVEEGLAARAAEAYAAPFADADSETMTLQLVYTQTPGEYYLEKLTASATRAAFGVWSMTEGGDPNRHVRPNILDGYLYVANKTIRPSIETMSDRKALQSTMRWRDTSADLAATAQDPEVLAEMRHSNLIGASFNDSAAVAWFSNFGYHDVAISLAGVHAALLRALVPDASLVVYNHPLESTYDNQRDDQVQSYVMATQLSSGIGSSLSLLSALYVMFYIKERVIRAKLLQKASGIQPAVLWGSASIFDWCWFQVAGLGFIIACAAFQVEGLSSAKELGRFFLCLMVYGAAMLPLVYIFSYFFEKHSTGFSVLFFVNVLFVFIPVLLSMPVCLTFDSDPYPVPSFHPGPALYGSLSHFRFRSLSRSQFSSRPCSLWRFVPLSIPIPIPFPVLIPVLLSMPVCLTYDSNPYPVLSFHPGPALYASLSHFSDFRSYPVPSFILTCFMAVCPTFDSDPYPVPSSHPGPALYASLSHFRFRSLSLSQFSSRSCSLCQFVSLSIPIPIPFPDSINLNNIGITINTCMSSCDMYSTLFPIEECTMQAMCEYLPSCCMDEHPYFNWEQPGIAKSLTLMFISCVIFWMILMIFEYRLPQKVFNREVKPSPLGNLLDEDEDVREETRHAESVPLSNLHNHNLVAKKLTKYYGKNLAVNQVSFTVGDDECFGLLGVNGAGKTSTFKMLMGDETVSSGDAYVQGHSVKTHIRRVHENIGYCPQFDAIFEELTGRETIQLFGLLRGLRRELINSRAVILARKLGFIEHLDKKVDQYSGGNKRKLSTAIALLGSTRLVFLDEPTTGVDPAAKRQVWRAVRRTTRAGRGVVLTSHSMEECEALCSRLTIMVNGRFRCLGTPQHLKNKFSQGFTLTIKISVDDSRSRNEQIEEVKNYVASNFHEPKLMQAFNSSAGVPRGTTGNVCLKSPANNIIKPPKMLLFRRRSFSVKLSASSDFLCAIVHSSQTMSLHCINNFPIALDREILHVGVSIVFKLSGNLSAECAVRPPSRRVAAIPDDANAKAMSHLDRIVAKINEMTNVFPVPPGASRKNRPPDEQCTYDLVHQLKTPVASLELGFLVCDVGISLLIDSKCNTWAFQRTSASLRMDLLHIAKKLVNVVDGGLSARCAALASVK